MEEYFEGLHLIDFEQLKIENNVNIKLNIIIFYFIIFYNILFIIIDFN